MNYNALSVGKNPLQKRICGFDESLEKGVGIVCQGI